VSDRIGEKCSEFGVLFVPGFAEQRSGGAIESFAAAIYRWLFRWKSSPCEPQASPPVLSETVLYTAGDEPAHLTLAADLHLSTGERRVRWLVAESSWADAFTPPGFLGAARWIWKFSTCLLVLQFVIPMHRHWRRARRPTSSWRRGLADRVIAGCYLAPMGVAAMASVVSSGLLIILALMEKLPIPRIDKAVQWVSVKISGVLGDSYMLAHCPVQFAAMHTQVARDLRWLQERCDRVAIVAHSQGAAIAYQVLQESGYRPGNMQAFVTLGQGISKFNMLRRMDWCPQQAQQSRLLVTTGMLLTGLPAALRPLARHWTSAEVLQTLVSPLVAVGMVVAGFVMIAIGVRKAMKAVRDHLEEDLAPLPNAGFSWHDYYASADPVSYGPIWTGVGHTISEDESSPRPCRQVYNSASILFDHNRYLRNQDQVLSRLLNDLTAAAYGDGPARPEIVCEDDLKEAGKRRRRLVIWLIAGRVLSVGVAALLWWLNPGPLLKDPMNWVMDLFVPHTRIGDLVARFVAALLVTAVFYVAVVGAWRIREEYTMQRFFRTAKRRWGAEPPAVPAVPQETPVAVG
jgi:hypothetical protein